MQIGVSSYSFSRLMKDGAMTLFEAIVKAREMGFEAIEFAGLEAPEGECRCSFADKVRLLCEQEQMAVINYAIGADFIQGCNGNLNMEIVRVKEEVRVAQLLGSPCMRHDATWGFPRDAVGTRSFEAALPRIAEGCAAITAHAADLGIRTMVENHGYFCQDSERVEQLICAVNHPNFGALIDIGNFACVDEDSARAVGRLAPYAFHVHVKDFHLKSGMLPFPGEGWFASRAGNYLRGAIIGHGDIAIAQCLKLLRSAGYNGPWSIEFEGMEDPLMGIALGATFLKRLLSVDENGAYKQA